MVLLRRLLLSAVLLLLAAQARADITAIVTSPAGSNESVQFNKNRRFGGDSYFTYSTTTHRLTVPYGTIDQITWPDGSSQTSAVYIATSTSVLGSSLTWTGQNAWTSPAESIFTYGVTVGTLAITSQSLAVSTVTFSSATISQANITGGLAVSYGVTVATLTAASFNTTASSATISGVSGLAVTYGVTAATATFSGVVSVANGTAAGNAINFGQYQNPPINILDNGGFEGYGWKRGLTFSAPASLAYLADRWYCVTSEAASVTVTQETTTIDSVGLASMKVVIAAAGASQNWYLRQNVENYADYRGKTLVLTVRAKASVANSVALELETDTQQVDSLYHTGGGAWETLTATMTVSATATMLRVRVGGFNVGDKKVGTYYIDNAMLAIGSTGVAFVPTNPQIDDARCKRFFQVIGGLVTTEQIGVCMADAATQCLGLFRFPVEMRVAPTATVNNATNFRLTLNTAAVQAVTALALDRLTVQSARFTADVASGLLAGDTSMLQTANANASIYLSSDL